MPFEALPEPGSMQNDYGVLEGGWVDSQQIEDWLENYHLMAYGPVEDKAYEFAIDNPCIGNPQSLRIAQESFAKVQYWKSDFSKTSWILGAPG